MLRTSDARATSSSAIFWFSRTTFSSDSASERSVRASSSAFEEMKFWRASSSARFSFFAARSSRASAALSGPTESARCLATARAARSGPESSDDHLAPFHCLTALDGDAGDEAFHGTADVDHLPRLDDAIKLVRSARRTPEESSGQQGEGDSAAHWRSVGLKKLR